MLVKQFNVVRISPRIFPIFGFELMRKCSAVCGVPGYVVSFSNVMNGVVAHSFTFCDELFRCKAISIGDVNISHIWVGKIIKLPPVSNIGGLIGVTGLI